MGVKRFCRNCAEVRYHVLCDQDGQFTLVGALYYLHRDYLKRFKDYPSDLVGTIGDYISWHR